MGYGRVGSRLANRDLQIEVQLSEQVLNSSVSIVTLILFPEPNLSSVPLTNRSRDFKNKMGTTGHDLELAHSRFELVTQSEGP